MAPLNGATDAVCCVGARRTDVAALKDDLQTARQRILDAESALHSAKHAHTMSTDRATAEHDAALRAVRMELAAEQHARRDDQSAWEREKASLEVRHGSCRVVLMGAHVPWRGAASLIPQSRHESEARSAETRLARVQADLDAERASGWCTRDPPPPQRHCAG